MSPNTDRNKAIGLVLMFVFIPVQLLLFGAFVYILLLDDIPDNASEAFSMLFVMGIFSFPLIYGIRLWKTGDQQLNRHTTPPDENSRILITTKCELKSYRKLLFVNTYKHPMILFLHVIVAGLGFNYLTGTDMDYFAWVLLFFVALIPLAVLRSATANYRSSKHMHETVTYEFTPSMITITGETFNTTMKWESLHKVSEARDWFLLYTNKTNAMLILKRHFGSPQDLTTFRQMLSALPV
jgi:hypothetical protein